MTDGANPTVRTYYRGPFVYTQTGSVAGSLNYISTPEGRLVNTGTYSAPVWKWEYNLTDHLGNVRVVITPHETLAGYSTWLQQTNYYPFGMLELSGNPAFAGKMSSLSATLSTTNNDLLYNGKELQDDFGLNWYDYGARFYDPALGRFHTIDRFAEKYMDFTPYQYGANNPIKFIDINGDSLWITHRTGFLGLGGKETLRYENGNLYNKDGTAYTEKVKGFLSKSVGALNEASSTTTGNEMVDEIQGSSQNVTIIKSNEGNSYSPGINTVKFNTASGNGGLNTRGSTERPSFIGLGHELAHSLDDVRGTLNLQKIPGQSFTYAEHFATHTENQMRAEHGMPLRTHYGIDPNTGTGIYPLINSSGQSLHNNGHSYYGALMLTPKRALVPVTTITPGLITK